MKMVVGLVVVLVAAFALPSAFASSEIKDVITREAYEKLVNSGAMEGVAMTKTIISNPVLEEALITYSKNKLGGSIFNCGETCILGTCYTPGCSCVYGACSKNSLQGNNNKAVKDVITREAYENLVKSGAIEGIAMTKTVVSNPVLEEALVTYSTNKLGGSIFNCGETCILGTCYTPGCSCVYGACSKNSLQGNNNKAVKDVITREAYENLVKSGAIEGIAMTKTVVSNPVLEEALVTYSTNKLGGSIFNCGETCILGTCYTPGCSCVYGACSKNSLQGNNNKAVKDVITRDAYENLVKSGAIEGIAMTKTIVSSPVLEEALVTYSKNKLGGSIFNCGETCILGTCYTPGCSCVYGACSKNSLAAN